MGIPNNCHIQQCTWKGQHHSIQRDCNDGIWLYNVRGCWYRIQSKQPWLMVLDQITRKKNKATTVITAYNPCISKFDQPSTVYMQHTFYLTSIDQDTCPQEAAQDNLSNFISARQQRRRHIILCIDLNKDTNRTNGPLQKTLLCTNKIVEIMKHRHNMLTPPNEQAGDKNDWYNLRFCCPCWRR